MGDAPETVITPKTGWGIVGGMVVTLLLSLAMLVFYPAAPEVVLQWVLR